jgi:type II secretory pathway pseudopilin PulG
MNRKEGYILIVLMVAIFVLSIGLLVAIPVWETQLRREREEELIFRGKQYVEAIRVFQMKNPGSFPKTLDELLEEKCIRKLYKDPISEEGKWNVILLSKGITVVSRTGVQKVLVAPQSALSSVQSPEIIGVVSSSSKKSIKIYNDQETYDQWLFFYGQDPKKMPEIIYYGQPEKE